MDAKFLTKRERLEVMSQVGAIVARRLEQLKNQGIYYVDISRATGLQANRLSEIVNNREITETGFKALLEGGIIKVSDVQEHLDLSEREKSFLDGFRVHENKHEIGKLIVQLKDSGVDVTKLLAKAARLGPGVVETLDRAIREADKKEG